MDATFHNHMRPEDYEYLGRALVNLVGEGYAEIGGGPLNGRLELRSPRPIWVDNGLWARLAMTYPRAVREGGR